MALRAAKGRATIMTDDPVCKTCPHPLSAHTLSRAEKRAKMEGTLVMNGFPSSGDKGEFNYHAGGILLIWLPRPPRFGPIRDRPP